LSCFRHGAAWGCRWSAKSVKTIIIIIERRPRFGALIQIDASPQDWPEGWAPRCALIAFVDDATGRLIAPHMAKAEMAQAVSPRAPPAFPGAWAAAGALLRPPRRLPRQRQAGAERLRIEQICALRP
jgi:hypothetical protein